MPPVACLYVSPSGMRPPPISDIQRHPLAASLIPFDQTVMREARSLKALERHGLVERGENMWLPTARADEALARRREPWSHERLPWGRILILGRRRFGRKGANTMRLFDALRRPKGDMSLQDAMDYLGLTRKNIERLVRFEELSPASTDPLRFDKSELDDFNRRTEEQHEAMKEFIHAGEDMHLDEGRA